jgi:hypothetical protein
MSIHTYIHSIAFQENRDRGVNILTRGQISPLGAKFTPTDECIPGGQEWS